MLNCVFDLRLKNGLAVDDRCKPVPQHCMVVYGCIFNEFRLASIAQLVNRVFKEYTKSPCALRVEFITITYVREI